jgi:hypothetical protein
MSLWRAPFSPEIGYVAEVHIATAGYDVRVHDYGCDLHAMEIVLAPCTKADIDAAIERTVKACRSWYPTERERLIGMGLLTPFADRAKRPVLYLGPGERERFEREAREAAA